MGRHRCECGRPAVCLPRVRAKSSKKSRAGVPVHVKHHWLCLKCFRKQSDSERAQR